jgi:hypothetical protein
MSLATILAIYSAVSVGVGLPFCWYVIHPLVVRHHAAEPSRDGIAHVVGVHEGAAVEKHGDRHGSRVTHA